MIDLDGKVLAEIRRRPLQEAQTRGNDPAAENAPRDVGVAAGRQGPVDAAGASLPATVTAIRRARIA